MSNLNNRASLHPLWTKAPLRPLEGFASAIIAIFEPNGELDGRDYNPFTNRDTNPMVEMWRGKGQLQVFRQTLNADGPAGSVTQVRSVRFTIPLEANAFPVRKGLVVRVIECEHDPDATNYEYTVTSGINSGLAFKRTIEAESDMSVIVTPVAVTP